MARPKKTVDEKLLKDLAFIHLPDQYIAHCLGISVWTLNRRYAQKIEEYKSQGKAKLLSKAWAAVDKGEWPAIKFLLNNWLGMSEKVDQTIATSQPIFVSYDPSKMKRSDEKT